MSTRTVGYRATPHGRHPLPHARPLDGPRDHHRGRARRDLRRPGDRRGARAGRHRAAAPAEHVEPPVGRREPAVLQLVRPAGAQGPQRLPDVRAPHGAAEPGLRLDGHAIRPAEPACPSPDAATLLRVMPRPGHLVGLAAVSVLGLGLGACGSTTVDEQVPKTVPAITVPEDAFAGAPTSTSTTDTTSTSTTSTTTTPTTATPGATGAGTATPSAPAAGTGGGATPQTGGGTAQGGGATPQTGAGGGGTAQGGGTGGGQGGGAGFQGFCQQNPGAC